LIFTEKYINIEAITSENELIASLKILMELNINPIVNLIINKNMFVIIFTILAVLISFITIIENMFVYKFYLDSRYFFKFANHITIF